MNPPLTALQIGEQSARVGFEGVMPLARQLGKIVGRGPNHPKDGTLELSPINTRVVRLDPTRWGFETQAEMDAAFAEDEPA